MISRTLTASSLLLLALALAACNLNSTSGSGSDGGSPQPPDPPPAVELPPNILFVIMDDVGTDQMTSMGYGGHEAPAMPSINAIADAGVRFRNTWSMPECSPGRSALMT